VRQRSKWLASLKPDLVLMDVQLAGEMDGIEATGLIWSQFHIPIVYLTGSSDEETVVRGCLDRRLWLPA